MQEIAVKSHSWMIYPIKWEPGNVFDGSSYDSMVYPGGSVLTNEGHSDFAECQSSISKGGTSVWNKHFQIPQSAFSTCGLSHRCWQGTYNMPLAKHNTYAVCHVTLRHLNKTGLCTLNRAQTIAVPLHRSQQPACSSDSWDCCLQQILSAYHSCSMDGSLLWQLVWHKG